MEAARPLMLAGALALAVLVAPLAGADGALAGGTTRAPDASRQRELLTLLRQDCGSCHGMRLTGGLGPALTPDALREKPRDSLAATIQHGRPGTPMPPWRPFMSDAEAAWLVTQLVEGVPDAPR